MIILSELDKLTTSRLECSARIRYVAIHFVCAAVYVQFMCATETPTATATHVPILTMRLQIIPQPVKMRVASSDTTDHQRSLLLVGVHYHLDPRKAKSLQSRSRNRSSRQTLGPSCEKDTMTAVLVAIECRTWCFAKRTSQVRVETATGRGTAKTYNLSRKTMTACS